MNRLKEKYEKEVRGVLAQEFKIKNILAVPEIEKVVVNSGIGEVAKNKETLEKAINELSMITGQKPIIKRARVSIAGFGLRKGSVSGLKITLRGLRAYNFLDKLISIVFPRFRDFKGMSLNSFDKYGNFSIGISDLGVFSEIDITKLERGRGLEVTIVTNTNDVEKGKRLLELLGLPFERGSYVK